MPIQQSEKRRTTQPKHEAKYSPPRNNSAASSYTAALTRLVYSYSTNAAQSASAAGKTWIKHAIAVPVVEETQLQDVINQSPFVLKSKGATYYVQVVVRFGVNANLGRYVLACRRNTTDAEMPVLSVLQKTDAETNTPYLEMVMEDDFFFAPDDEMRIVLRCFNESTTSQTLTILSAKISVAILQ